MTNFRVVGQETRLALIEILWLSGVWDKLFPPLSDFTRSGWGPGIFYSDMQRIHSFWHDPLLLSLLLLLLLLRAALSALIIRFTLFEKLWYFSGRIMSTASRIDSESSWLKFSLVKSPILQASLSRHPDSWRRAEIMSIPDSSRSKASSRGSSSSFRPLITRLPFVNPNVLSPLGKRPARKKKDTG